MEINFTNTATYQEVIDDYKKQKEANGEDKKLTIRVRSGADNNVVSKVIKNILDDAKIKILDLLYSDGLTPAKLKQIQEPLENEQTLNCLILTNNRLEDESIPILVEILSNNKGIKNLRIGLNNITDKGAEELYKFLQTDQAIEWLDISYNKITNAKFLLANNLRIINAEFNGIEELTNILPFLSNMQSIDFSGNPIKKVDPEILDYIIKNRIILDLRDTKILLSEEEEYDYSLYIVGLGEIGGAGGEQTKYCSPYILLGEEFGVVNS